MTIMPTALDKELSSYLKQLNNTEKKSVLQSIKKILKGRSKQAGRISIEQYNKEIDEAMSEVKAGNYISQEEMEKKAAKW